MNENEINVLLDRFVDGLDVSESDRVTELIDSQPVWSDMYKRINNVFGCLEIERRHGYSQEPPRGLVNRTLQRLADYDQSHQTSSSTSGFTANRSNTANSSQRSSKIKPSFLAMCVCAGFLLITVPAAWLLFAGQIADTSNSASFVSATHSSDNPYAINNSCPHNFAFTGYQAQPDSALTFCSNSNSSDESTLVSCSNSGQPYTINNADYQLVDLSGNNSNLKTDNAKIACPDGCVVLVSHPNMRPVVVVPEKQLPAELHDVQNCINPGPAINNSFVVPVSYRQ